MEASSELRVRLRKMLNERIPAGGTEAETNFLDAELNQILAESITINAAAASGWREKAGLLQGDIESYSIGNEKYDLTSLKDRLNHALAMAKQYEDAAAADKELASPGSLILGVCPPPVI
ncbi:hypothetical protein KIH86_07595 [Paenibacillus sp. HN-1]|uniref:hypothetical protein n=1 Tax=Paenibacillus TaxID=44249 RepID=UPI001CA8DE90|nr:MULTISPECIES: hypothetical protein [Paenibacillus]MBY9081001.1 hypothetical protein [Paenibacillus sp. CGMCC 1.18879]MBY9084103.1 hypothetical protein [Paenibacillus sinensis]